MFKKYITTFLMAIMLAVTVPALAGTANAQTTRYYRNNTRQTRVTKSQTYQRPNVYQRNRTAFNVGIGTGVGALIGGLVGGKKGLLIGALAGAGGGALTTYVQKKKQNNNDNTYYRRY